MARAKRPMKLQLRNAYPFPYPSCLTEAQALTLAEAAQGLFLTLDGVLHFEWLHTVTIEFSTPNAMRAARSLTGWRRYDSTANILEAPTSSNDGYNHPAILARGRAYCGFVLF
jgi:hypothetical protein